MRGGPCGRSLASPRPAPPSASARSRRLQTPGRVSPHLGGARLGPGWGPRCPCGVAPSGARSPAPNLRRPRLAGPRPRLLLVHTFGAPAPPCVKPWRAPRYCQAAYCDSDEGVRPVGHSQRASPGTAAPAERHLQVTRRPPLASRPGPVSTRRRTGARIRMPQGRPPARAWLHRRAELAPWPPPEALPPWALCADPTRLPHTICSGTMRACQNGGPPPLPFWERPPPPPLPFSGGEERRARRPAGRARARGRDWARHTCGREGSTNPGCNYLVRGYSPSMHYFWRGDMPHFSSPLPFQRGACGCRAAAVPRPPRLARRRPRPARAGRSGAAGVGGPPRWSPDPRGRRGHAHPPFRQGWHPWPAPGSGHPCRRGPARGSPCGPSAAGRDRRNLKLARRTGRGPAAASATPRRRRPCPIFTLLLILLTTPS